MSESGANRAQWRFWVDRGGTFTDVVARAPDGALHVEKLLSEDPGRYADAASEAMRRLTGVCNGPLPPCELRLGTTVATNALLERKGEPVLLAITAGLGDVLRIGTQDRPDIFAHEIVLPDPLYADVLEIDERLQADGAVLVPLDEAAARAGLAAAHARGLRAVAIVLMHGWKHTGHEARLAEIAREVGFAQVSVGHRVAPLMRIVPRGDTSVADAYLSPVLGRYIAGLESALGPQVSALYMQSGGGLATGAAFHGKDAVLSGPAGGIVGMAAVARGAGFDRAVGFDMGGTSTDVSWFAGTYERESEPRVAGVRIRAPMLRIHTVAAGGGSICRVASGRMLVGPESAGAVPGPAAYRRGGPLTVTDCNFALGKLDPAHFPQVFGPGGNEPADTDAVLAALDGVRAELPGSPPRETVAEGFVEIAVAQMAQAIKAVSVQRGHDVAGAALVCFGGAGGQHACRVAEALGMDTVLLHPLASVLSAYGIGLARQSAILEATLGVPLEDAGAIDRVVARLADEAGRELGSGEGAERLVTVTLRPAGSENGIEVSYGDPVGMAAAFAAGWRTRFGFDPSGPLVAESVRVEVSHAGAAPDGTLVDLRAVSAPPVSRARFHSRGAWHDAPLHARSDLAAGALVTGPALVVDPVSTVVIEPGWRGEIAVDGTVVLRRSAAMPLAARDDTALDPVRLELMAARFMGIAEEMGAALRYSAASVNIRERLDFSCALFDREGGLVANAPHMPVHLGSMGESVRAVMGRRGDGRGIRRGDAYLVNAPFAGGTHLPDLTVIVPVFVDERDAEPAWWVAARGHHADLGGIAPGSMPPDSRTLADEGVLFDNVLLLDAGALCAADIRARLGEGPWPARNPDQNMADLAAQLAACARGAAGLTALAGEVGRGTVDAYMGHVQDAAEAAVRALMGELRDGAFAYEMDNGAVVRVAVTVNRDTRSATIDFAGTSAQLADNFNAPLPVVRAAVLYVFRMLAGGTVPMNEGCLRPLTIRVPAGSMLSPGRAAAVVAGNVETSQVVTDALLGALGAMAAAQGTMNNFTFGDDARQYYETIAGGSGAGPDFAGASAVQTHMTNSRLTDPEVLETVYPVLLERFAVRRGSGGAGRERGGDGAERRVRFLAPMRAGILANRRRVPPFGMAGGEPGACGRNRVERADGRVEELPAVAAVGMAPGDVFVIETPGGGGFGVPD